MSKSSNKDAVLIFRVSPHDRLAVLSKAKQARVSVSDFCRKAVLEKEVKYIEGLDSIVYDLGGLRAVIEYIKDSEKTDGGKFVHMSGGMVGNEFQQMAITKKLFGKTDGRQYAHFIQSFHKKDKLTPEVAFKIGQEFIDANERWRGFQVVMAVHTNSEHIHIHYVINSVNSRDGSKWQCSKQDLKRFRQQSDELCRIYNLHVIEHGNRGHKSYGEYTANLKGGSWKQRLATDIADCLQQAKSKADFLHRLEERGIDADFGARNVMFTVRAESYGLKKDTMCSNHRLMGYGDFSKENIINHLKANKGLIELALDDFSLLQDAFLTVGAALFPDNLTNLQDLFLGGTGLASFDGKTREEIEAFLKRKKLEQLQKKALAEWEKQPQSGGMILACIADSLSLIHQHLDGQWHCDGLVPEHEQGYEL